MTTKYTRNPSAKDFLEWANKHFDEFESFYDEIILEQILELEQDDYFGTEGFDKRFS